MPSDVRPLADLLRAWRTRLVPADVGIESFGRRRTKGLRREELAQLAGVSIDYIVRLEQGRSRTPSAQIVASLARALQLDRAETAAFYGAAGLTTPRPGSISHHIPPGVQRMIVRMSDLPLAVFAADWTLLHSTSLWQTLFGSPSVMTDPGQNLVLQTFVDESIADVATAHGGPLAFEQALVADLRRTATSSWTVTSSLCPIQTSSSSSTPRHRPDRTRRSSTSSASEPSDLHWRRRGTDAQRPCDGTHLHEPVGGADPTDSLAASR
jgi:transcriptional regulator with XRE-family HTH domain